MKLDVEQALQKGIAAHKEGKLQEAEHFYRTILQSQPAHPDANHNLGVLSASLNKTGVALPLFKIAVQANPKIEQFWLSYIDVLIKEKQFGAAKHTLEQAKKQGIIGEKINSLTAELVAIPQKDNAKSISPSRQQLNSLVEYYQTGRFDAAEKQAISLTEKFPRHQLAWKVLGAVLLIKGRNSEAINANLTAVELSPQDAAAHSNLGNTLKILGRFEESAASLGQAIILDPDFAEAHSNLGNTLKEMGRLVEAETSFRKAIALKPNLVEALINLGITLKILGRLEEAEASYLQVISLKPDFFEAHINLGNTLKELGRLEEAVISFKKAIALKPDFAKAHSNLGVTFKELGRLEEAEASYSQAIEIKPDFTMAIRNRWLLLFKKKRFEAALIDADSLISKGSTQVDLTTLYALGRIDEIYKRIEIRSKIDSENISIAAFAAFVSKVEKKDVTYNFCLNPMDYIYYSNISSHLKDSTNYIRDVMKQLDKVTTIWEPDKKTTIKGFQSPTGYNLFESPSGEIAKLKSIIIDELEVYYKKYSGKSCNYIKKWPVQKNLNGWHVILKQQGYQNPHIHPSGWLSGVIYLKVVPSLGKKEGAIEFTLDGESYSDINSSKLTYQPKSGDIVFFPSSLHHRTIPFSTDTDRIIVSFDLKPNQF